MNFPQARVITRHEFELSSREVSSRLVYNDVYRKRVNGLPALSWNSMAEEIRAFQPFRRDHFTVGLSAVYLSTQGRFQNRKDHTGLQVENYSDGSVMMFQLAGYDGVRLLGIGLEGLRLRHETPVLIKYYPTSENRFMQLYFLDWLEPTFGQELSITGNRETLKPSIYIALPVWPGELLSLSLSHSVTTMTPVIGYNNSSNKPELTGNRAIDIGLRAREDVLLLKLEDESAGATISAALFNSRFAFNLDNNPPQTEPIQLDHESLGRGEGGRSGFGLCYSRATESFRLELGLGRGSYTGKAELNTPVLGYYAKIFPVSHAVEGKLKGHSDTQQIKATLYRSVFGIQSSLLAGYSHGFFDLHVEGDAQLEFNLVSVPVDHPLQYHLHLFELSWRLTSSRGPVSGYYCFTQYLPLLKRADESPIRLFREVPGIKVDSRGGGVHQLALSFRW